MDSAPQPPRTHHAVVAERTGGPEVLEWAEVLSLIHI